MVHAAPHPFTLKCEINLIQFLAAHHVTTANSQKVVVSLQRGGTSVSSVPLKLKSNLSNSNTDTSVFLQTASGACATPPPLTLGINLYTPPNANAKANAYSKKSFNLLISSFPDRTELANFILNAAKFANIKPQVMEFSTSFSMSHLAMVQPSDVDNSFSIEDSLNTSVNMDSDENESVDVKLVARISCVENDGSENDGDGHNRRLSDSDNDEHDEHDYDNDHNHNHNHDHDHDHDEDDSLDGSEVSFASSSRVNPNEILHLKNMIDKLNTDLESERKEASKEANSQASLEEIMKVGGDLLGERMNEVTTALDVVRLIVEDARKKESELMELNMQLEKRKMTGELLARKTQEHEGERDYSWLHPLVTNIKMRLASLGAETIEKNLERVNKLQRQESMAHKSKHEVASRHHRIMQELNEKHSVEESYRKERQMSVKFAKDALGILSQRMGGGGNIEEMAVEEEEEEEDDDANILIIDDDDFGEIEGGDENPASDKKGFFAARGLVRLRTRNTKLKDTIVKLGKDVR